MIPVSTEFIGSIESRYRDPRSIDDIIYRDDLDIIDIYIRFGSYRVGSLESGPKLQLMMIDRSTPESSIGAHHHVS